jgi:hypothetical protein
VKGAASAALGEIMFLGGVDGVNDGESTLNFPRPKLLNSIRVSNSNRYLKSSGFKKHLLPFGFCCDVGS